MKDRSEMTPEEWKEFVQQKLMETSVDNNEATIKHYKTERYRFWIASGITVLALIVAILQTFLLRTQTMQAQKEKMLQEKLIDSLQKNHNQN
jgi:heme exporter protein D